MRGYPSTPTQAHNRPNQQIKLHGHHRPRTIKATQPKEDNMIKRTKGAKKLLNPFMGENNFLTLLKNQPTLNDKMCRIVEANPLLLVFGTNLDSRNPYERNNDGQA